MRKIITVRPLGTILKTYQTLKYVFTEYKHVFFNQKAKPNKQVFSFYLNKGMYKYHHQTTRP